MTGYQVIHIDNKRIVCFEQTRLISFDHKWKALKTMQTAVGLIEGLNSRRANVLASPQEWLSDVTDAYRGSIPVALIRRRLTTRLRRRPVGRNENETSGSIRK